MYRHKNMFRNIFNDKKYNVIQNLITKKLQQYVFNVTSM